MSKSRIALAAALLLAVFASGVHAQTPEVYKPYVGQAGKDVVWVPSPQALVDKMLEMAKVTPADFLMDLGSGDGITVITAAKRGVRALGIEYNPDMVALSRHNALEAGASDMATFVEADIFETDLSRASVITLFLLPELNLRLRPEILKLKPGTRIVSNSFRMGDWDPDETFELGCGSYCTAFLWLVPAQVAGKWKLAQGELTLMQKYQKLDGSLLVADKLIPIVWGSMRGEEISFTAGVAEYRGKLANGEIRGTITSGEKTEPFRASR